MPFPQFTVVFNSDSKNLGEGPDQLLLIMVLMAIQVEFILFKAFIGPDMRLDPVVLKGETTIDDLLKFYMGKNTPDRQNFIIDNLKVDDTLNEN